MNETTMTEPTGEARSCEYAIVINGELAVVPHETVSYDEVVYIAYPVPPKPDTTYTVTFHDAKEPRREGILVAGRTVEVREEGTYFDVVEAGKS